MFVRSVYYEGFGVKVIEWKFEIPHFVIQNKAYSLLTGYFKMLCFALVTLNKEFSLTI